MGSKVTALYILIASPSDVAAERAVIRDAMLEWNEVHGRRRGVLIQPVMWETMTFPLLGDRPQGVVNQQIDIDKCDALVGTFWTRVGSPTGVAESGSVEEIQRMRAVNKPVMLYFSRAPVDPDRLDPAQYEGVKRFKDAVRTDGLVWEYSSTEELRQLFSRQLVGLVERLILKDEDGQLVAGQATEGTATTPAKCPVSLLFNDKVKIEKMHRDDSGTVVQHDYLLTATLKNEGTKTLRSWHIDLEIPALLLCPGVAYASKVEWRTTHELAFFRMTDEARPGGLKPGDSVHMTLLYRIDDQVYYEHQEVFAKTIRATAYVDDELAATVDKSVEEMTSF